MIKEIIERCKLESPKIFKQLQVIFGTIGVASTAGLTFSDNLPSWLTTIFGYGLSIGAIGAFLSKLPVLDTDKLKENIK